MYPNCERCGGEAKLPSEAEVAEVEVEVAEEEVAEVEVAGGRD